MEESVLFLIYLFYGAAFFAIGVAIVARLKTFASLRIAGLFWLLALFAFTHSFHEWLELYLYLEIGTEPFRLQARYLSLSLLLASFIFLFFFGINLHRVLNPRTRPYLVALFLLLATSAFLFLYIHLILQQPLFLGVVDHSIRKLFAIPATLLTGSGFILYARQLRTLSRKGAGNFAGAGVAFIFYGIFTGIFPSTALLAQLPIQFWRGLTAFVILHFIMYALDRFLAERDALISEKLQRAAHSDKLSSIGRLAAGIAHEINNPLANASLQLELLQKDPALAALPPKTRERVGNVERNVARSARIASDLLLFAGKRQKQLVPEPVDLVKVIAVAWQTLSHRNAGHRLRCRLPATLLVPGVALRLEQLFANLFHNAIDATPAGGVITVSGREEADQTIITITDQGEGIAPEKLGLIMEPFYTTKEVGQGTGLGLAICYGIMMEHDGSIDLFSPPEGLGTTVRLVFKRNLTNE
jgi:two-component system, NtrC family, sensor kinase